MHLLDICCRAWRVFVADYHAGAACGITNFFKSSNYLQQYPVLATTISPSQTFVTQHYGKLLGQVSDTYTENSFHIDALDAVVVPGNKDIFEDK